MTRRILLIEPDRELSWTLFSLLQIERGEFSYQWYEVEVAESVASAVSQARRTDFGCMIVDVDLPGVPGYEVVPLFRDITRNAPIIMVSARNSLELERKVREQGVHSYHIAPFNQDELLSAVYCAFKEAERNKMLSRPSTGHDRQFPSERAIMPCGWRLHQNLENTENPESGPEGVLGAGVESRVRATMK